MISRVNTKALLILSITAVLFHWKLLLTHQFSLLTRDEAVNLTYSFLSFFIRSIRHGHFPLWDSFMMAGRSFAGDMQSGAYYPLHLPLALLPFDRHGVLLPGVYNWLFALNHLLGACFMYALGREFRLSPFSSIIAGIGFGFGGFVARAPWPQYFESAIWLPLVFLFFKRALERERLQGVLWNAVLSGLAIALTLLAGGLHQVIMQALALIGLTIFAVFHPQLQSEPKRQSWLTPVIALAGAGVTSACASAIQLLPSLEFSGHAIRFITMGSAPASAVIPYAQLKADYLFPNGVMSFLIPYAFNGVNGSGELISPYIGVFPILAAIAALWKCWGAPWVRYLAFLALAAIVYSFGPFSFLHGLMYALVPKLYLAREPARFLYLTDFAIALLAGFGTQALVKSGLPAVAWKGLTRAYSAFAMVCVLFLLIPAFTGQPAINLWVYLSILIVLGVYGLYRAVVGGNATRSVKAAIFAVLVFDLGCFDWTAYDISEVKKHDPDQLERAFSAKPSMDFLRRQPGLFRVDIQADPILNFGDLYGVQTVRNGNVATFTTEYAALYQSPDILSAAYVLKPASAPEPGAIYQDASWKIYARPQAFPRAWLVHITVVEPSIEKQAGLIQVTDLHNIAIVGTPLSPPLEPGSDIAHESFHFLEYSGNQLSLDVDARSRALLVLSELYDSGWRASINGARADILRVDAGLRGLAVPSGRSHIELRYLPGAFIAGAILSGLTWGGALVFGIVLWRRKRA